MKKYFWRRMYLTQIDAISRQRMLAGHYFPGREKYTRQPPCIPYRGTPVTSAPETGTKTADDLLQGMRELTHDDLIAMWQNAQTMPEPDRTKAIQQITRAPKQFESSPASMLLSILL
jgi:hypothetical protein